MNEQLKTNLKPEDIEQYNTSYINTLMQNEEADVVYKLKGKNEFFLIEHQSKVDYRMPFRILKYEMAIIESTIDEKECKKKDYLYPRVNVIVLYTGKQKWNVAQTFNETQVTSILEKSIEFAKYTASSNFFPEMLSACCKSISIKSHTFSKPFAASLNSP